MCVCLFSTCLLLFFFIFRTLKMKLFCSSIAWYIVLFKWCLQTNKCILKVLIFCIEFNMWLIASLEKNECYYKLRNWQNDIYFHLNDTFTILSEIDVIFCICQLSTTCFFFSAGFEISHALNGTTFKIQQKKWGPKLNLVSLSLHNKSMMISFSPQSW